MPLLVLFLLPGTCLTHLESEASFNPSLMALLAFLSLMASTGYELGVQGSSFVSVPAAPSGSFLPHQRPLTSLALSRCWALALQSGFLVHFGAAATSAVGWEDE